MTPSLLLINPWIYDFAAYDLWSKPLGLLYLAGFLRAGGYSVHLIDCLDVHHPEMRTNPFMKPPIRRSFGTGKFFRQRVPPPGPLKEIKRPYGRYGIARELFLEELKRMPRPSAVLVTSLMTYWYPGVQEVVTIAREIFPHTPIILGGIYARLCKEHARRFCGADYVADGVRLDNMRSLLDILDRLSIPIPGSPPETPPLPYPAYDMLRKIECICLSTSTGCPYRCRYCATDFLTPLPFRRDPLEVLEEIVYWNKRYGVRDFAFYDDALLIGYKEHAGVLLENLIRKGLGLRFHTPNAIHIRELTSEVADHLFHAGFQTIRLGLETSHMAMHQVLDNKVSEGEFERAVYNLKKAGFIKRQIGAYILMGLPGQTAESVSNTATFVARLGVTPCLAEYSPIPKTPLWEDALSCSRYDLEGEPLFHNNTLLPCWDEHQRSRVPDLKKRVRELRGTPG